MINTKYLATYFTDLFNEFGKDLEDKNKSKYFKIFADEGELKKAVKEYGKQPKRFTNGIVEIISSTLTPIRDIRLNTYTVQVSMYVDLAMDGFTEDKESINLIKIRDIISKLIEEKNGTTTLVEIDGTTYSQSITISYPTNGTKSEVGYISDCMPIYWTFDIAMFEDGINANNCKLIVNDIEVPFTRMVLTRKRTAEQNNFAGDKATKTIMQMNGLSVDIVMPALNNNKFSNLIMEDVLNGGNFALNVKIETPVSETRFIGTFGDTVASLDIATNVGYNLSILEAKPDVLDYQFKDSDWQIIDTLKSQINITLEKEATVFWGDGNVEVLEAGEHVYNYHDNRVRHTIRIYGG